MNIPAPIQFTKMSGTGNDFILIDHRDGRLKNLNLSDFARAVCRRNFAVGADGLILIEPSEKADFSWQFFNGDGSAAEMCGNGARCAARFAFANNIAPAAMQFETVAGIIEATVHNEMVKIRLTAPEDIQLDREISLKEGLRTIHFVNTGVPHVVCFVDDIAAIPVKEWGREIRYHELFQPAGTNVNFVQVKSDSLVVRTYERGVEDETMACGTGATAAALISAMSGKTPPPVKVITSGGETLIIHFSQEDAGNGRVNEIFLEGPANFIYEGRLNSEALRPIKTL